MVVTEMHTSLLITAVKCLMKRSLGIHVIKLFQSLAFWQSKLECFTQYVFSGYLRVMPEPTYVDGLVEHRKDK